MTSFHVICGFGLPQSKILGTPMNWRSPEKNFEDFFLENTCACVLGPWPWPRALLSLASRVSVFGKAVLGLGLKPYVLDSTSVLYPHQYGFQSNYSTIHALLVITTTIKDKILACLVMINLKSIWYRLAWTTSKTRTLWLALQLLNELSYWRKIICKYKWTNLESKTH